MFIQQVLDKDAREQQEELEKVKQQKETYLQNLSELDHQIREKQGKRGGMNEEEYKLNVGLLKEYAQLKHQLHN